MGPRVTAVPNDSERRCQERRRKHRRLEQAPLTVPNNETESDSDSDDDDDDEDEDFEPTNYQPPTINRSAPSAAAIRLLSAGAFSCARAEKADGKSAGKDVHVEVHRPRAPHHPRIRSNAQVRSRVQRKLGAQDTSELPSQQP
jgi:hypothetical protein